MNIVETLEKLFSERLVSVCLHNLSISAKFKHNGLLIEISKISLDDIKSLKTALRVYKKQYNTPFLINSGFLEVQKDHYCIEILELKENAKVLFGDNPANNIDISNDALRAQLKREIASKILSIRGAFLELTLERKVIEDITYRSLYNFYLIAKYILFVVNIKTQEVFVDFEEHFNVDLHNTKELYFMEKRPSFDKLLPLFEGYMRELDIFLNIEF